MENSRRSNINCLMMIGVLAMWQLLVLFTCGFFWLGDRNDWRSTNPGVLLAIERSYNDEWLAVAFGPAGWIEHKLLSVEVDVRAESSSRVSGS